MSDFWENPAINNSFNKFKESVQKKFIKQNEAFKILKEPEKSRILQEAKLFFLEQMKIKEVRDRELFYYDEYGYKTGFFKVDDEVRTDKDGVAWNIPVYKDNDAEANPEATFSVDFPIDNRRLKIKIDKQFFSASGGPLDLGKKFIARGSGWYLYQPLEDIPLQNVGTKKNKKWEWITLADFKQLPNTIEKKMGKKSFFDSKLVPVMNDLNGTEHKWFNQLDPDEFNRYPGFRVFQLLEVR